MVDLVLYVRYDFKSYSIIQDTENSEMIEMFKMRYVFRWKSIALFRT